MRWFSVVAALLVLLMHRSNIKRLLAGTENKFKGLRKKK
jgi:glycerol-3-phosphate acyltransferase PlsY